MSFWNKTVSYDIGYDATWASSSRKLHATLACWQAWHCGTVLSQRFFLLWHRLQEFSARAAGSNIILQYAAARDEGKWEIRLKRSQVWGYTRTSGNGLSRILSLSDLISLNTTLEMAEEEHKSQILDGFLLTWILEWTYFVTQSECLPQSVGSCIQSDAGAMRVKFPVANKKTGVYHGGVNGTNAISNTNVLLMRGINLGRTKRTNQCWPVSVRLGF